MSKKSKLFKTILISSLATLSASESNGSQSDTEIKNIFENDIQKSQLVFSPSYAEDVKLYKNHRSHRSHYSHHSHRSHRSSY